MSIYFIYFILLLELKESIVSRFQNDQKGNKAKKREQKKSIAFRNDSIIESREVVHGRRNSSIALSLKTDTKEEVKEVTEQKGLPLDNLFHILYFSRTYFCCTKKKTNSYDLPMIRTGAEGKINLRNSFRN